MTIVNIVDNFNKDKKLGPINPNIVERQKARVKNRAWFYQLYKEGALSHWLENMKYCFLIESDAGKQDDLAHYITYCEKLLGKETAFLTVHNPTGPGHPYTPLYN